MVLTAIPAVFVGADEYEIVKVGLVYYYFTTKEDVFDNALNLYFENKKNDISEITEKFGFSFLDLDISNLSSNLLYDLFFKTKSLSITSPQKYYKSLTRLIQPNILQINIYLYFIII